MSKENFRFYIKVHTALNVQVRVTYEELHSVFADEVPPLRTVERWAKWFREGREEVEDEARPGRPVTETTTENIEQISHLIDDDPCNNIEELQEQTGLTNAAWVAKGHPPPTVVRLSKFAPKTLFSTSFKSNGPVIIHRIERGQTIDHRYYIDNFLQPAANEIKRQRSSFATRGIKVLHDNGKPHVHKAVCDYLESEDITIVPHPPNSPDLAACDFWLFDFVKQNIDEQNDAESLNDAITTFMYSIDPEQYRKTFDKWVERMQLRVDNNGEYFEHLMK
ncbi:unnamed protein product [Rotaria magnacalcarata]|uniref:Transposase n=1 Tax=Rotaria magnacalcarata TaxID=392030 RepID=A0A816YYM0_9BILA|nr:unnamed protein product [Rotaria magnacalcarata]CAF4055531.1 unnamed protein product [Rotaria magnacalcarata]